MMVLLFNTEICIVANIFTTVSAVLGSVINTHDTVSFYKTTDGAAFQLHFVR